MSFNLSEQEIKQRLIRLNNLEKLHAEAIKRNKRQGKQIQLLKQQIFLLQEQNKEKDKIIEKMALQLEELRIKVFGKKKGKKKDDDDLEPPKERQKSERGSSSYQRPIPTEITEEQTHKIDRCNLCQTLFKKKKIVVFYVEDIPFDKPQKTAVKHNVEKGYCDKCKKWIAAIPLPFAKCVLGGNIRKHVAYLSINQRLSFQQIEDQIRDIHQIKISQGEIPKILEKEANRLRPEYEKLKVRVQNQPAKHYDETVWKVANGRLGGYGWIMTGTETPEAVFLLGVSRGKGNIDTLNPGRGTAITDDYGAYRNRFDNHQLCWSHPHRKFRDLAESGELKKEENEKCVSDCSSFSGMYRELEQTVKTKFDYETTKQYFLEKLTEFSQPKPNDILKTKKLKTSLLKNKEKYLTCLRFPGVVPLDNNKAERGIRHLVIKRKISGGSKTDRGAETTSILASVLLSMKWASGDGFFQKYFLGGC